MTTAYAQEVNDHYGRPTLDVAILDGLRALGKDLDQLSPDDLAPVDQFHTRGKEATVELARRAGLQGETEVLDIGGGLGGAARTLAAEFNCRVTVLDLTAEYCRVGEMLTTYTRLSDRVRFQLGNALQNPFPDASVDAVWTQHSSMNVADKERLYAEIRRVLRPGGKLILHEIMAGAAEPILFPVPWAANPAISFLRPPADMRALIAGTGFRERSWLDTSKPALEWFRQRVAAATGNRPPLGLHLLLGEMFAPAFKNLVQNLAEDRITIIEAIFERV